MPGSCRKRSHRKQRTTSAESKSKRRWRNRSAAALLILAGITAAAVWYAGDRARLRAEAQSRGREVNREANAALDQAEMHLKALRAIG